MARLHTLPVPQELQKAHGTDAPIAMWTDLDAWIDQAASSGRGQECKRVADAAGDVAAASGSKLTPAEAEYWMTIDFDALKGQLATLKSKVLKAGCQAAFCHNDVLCGNVMVDCAAYKKAAATAAAGQHVDLPDGALHLIDFEYGSKNYRGFDIANHLNEWAGGSLELTEEELAAKVKKPAYNGVMGKRLQRTRGGVCLNSA